MRLPYVVLGLVLSTSLYAEDKFYPTLDANGRVTVLNAPDATKKEAVSSTDPAPISDPPKKADEKDEAIKKVDSTPPVVKQLEGETYLDSEELERRQYQPDGKQRFYYLPGGGVHHEVIESNEGLATSTEGNNDQNTTQDDDVLVISGEFEELTAESVKKTYTVTEQCVSGKQLKRAQQWEKTTEVWSRSMSSDLDNLPIKLLQMSDAKNKHLVSVRSYASRQIKPEFFMPVLVFLDEQGCVVGGGWRYWMHYEPATERRHAYVEGNVPVPVGVAYIEFFHPQHKIKAPFVFSRDGSLTVHILD